MIGKTLRSVLCMHGVQFRNFRSGSGGLWIASILYDSADADLGYYLMKKGK